MVVFKCKMCGGAMKIADQGFGQCPYCGTAQTFPKLDDERRAQMYERASEFRRLNEFDKALGIFEQILSEEPTDAEAYWSIVLCTYGIEYVEDPRTHRRIPTVNRAQYTSIFSDKNYISALKNADEQQKQIYEDEAKVIDNIQKGILEVSSKEEPFDIFICYKETDDAGLRTEDSVYAQDIYNALIKEGYKVFFSRITLENKLGTAYEPYIFAALNSAKVLLVVGTKKEHFNAPWVKNEWARFLALMKNNNNKHLIPVYKDINITDFPEEFAYLQAQDMSKIGYLQDVIHGVSKLVPMKQPVVEESPIVNTENHQSATGYQAFIDRGYMALEDRDWAKADQFFEQALNVDAKLSEAYIGKLLAEKKLSRFEQLKDLPDIFDKSANYKKAFRFADEARKQELIASLKAIIDRKENNRIENNYLVACQRMASAYSEKDFKEVSDLFVYMIDYKDSKQKFKECLEKAETARKQSIYAFALNNMSVGTKNAYQIAINNLSTIPDYKDSQDKIAYCKTAIEEIDKMMERDRLEKERLVREKREEEARRAEEERIAQEKKRLAKEAAAKKRKKRLIISIPIIIIIAIFIIVLNEVILPSQKLESEKNGLMLANVGDVVKFGAYEQDNDTSNGKEDIEWIVLKKEDDMLLLVSKYALDCQQYNDSDADVTWETCSLRKWLGNEFLNEAFNNKEQQLILKTTVSADKNPKQHASSGKATEDKIFLLSITEVNKYFTSKNNQYGIPTEYATSQGARESTDKVVDGQKSCKYWLRTTGYYQYNATVVALDGDIYENGYNVVNSDIAVRPAMWVDISSLK